ncbi:MAG: RNA methyltransferase [Ruminococcaceae bacterium]|nr:RNA methyltransferase [Oscillospiraceae bacterium]
MTERRIESGENAQIKAAKKLLEKKGRDRAGAFLIEGKRLVEDALRLGAQVTALFAADGADVPQGVSCDVFRLPERLFATLKTTVNSQGILGVVKNLDRPITPSSFENLSFAVYLDCVSDPGNLGTIIRTADAAGAEAVVLSKGCVDLYNPKVARATMASLFAVPVYREQTYGEGLETLLNAGFDAVAGSLEATESCFDADLTGKCAIVVGNEANGVSDAVLARCDRKVIIPMRGGAESLNAAVACGVLMYEYVRQNRKMR